MTLVDNIDATDALTWKAGATVVGLATSRVPPLVPGRIVPGWLSREILAEPPYNPWDDPASACTPDVSPPARRRRPRASLRTHRRCRLLRPGRVRHIRCREPPFQPGSLCEFCSVAALRRRSSRPRPTRRQDAPPTAYGRAVDNSVADQGSRGTVVQNRSSGKCHNLGDVKAKPPGATSAPRPGSSCGRRRVLHN